MTIFDFYQNPAGKNVTAINISAIKAQYEQRYDAIKSSLKAIIYRTKDAYFFRVGIPSSVNGVVYDAVVKFNSHDIKTSDISLYSNSPSFIYTYAYAYNKKGILIKELRNSIPKEGYKSQSEAKNPYNIISFDFSIYCVVKFVLDNAMNDIEYAIDIKKSDVPKIVKNFEDVVKTRKDKLDDERRMKQDERDQLTNIKQIKRSPGINSTVKVNTVPKIKRVKKI